MITYKPVIVTSNRRRDGTYPVKIRVTFKCKSRRLPTSLTCTSADLTRSLHIKNADILRRASLLIDEMRSTTDTLSPFTLEGWDIEDVVRHIKTTLTARNAKEEFRLDFYAFGEEFCAPMKPSTALLYRYALKSFKEFRQGEPTDVNDITRQMLQEFFCYLRDSDNHRRKDQPEAKSVRYITRLARIFKEARKKYNDADESVVLIPRNPFANIELPVVYARGQKNIGVEAIQTLIDAHARKDITQYAIDCFLFSFCTMGANAADIYYARLKESDKWWVYNRKKTADRRADRAEMRVKLLPPALHYWKRMCEFGVPSEKYKQEDVFKNGVCKQLRDYCKEQGIEPFSFYAARHSWASIARSAGVELATIDECLAHIGNYKVANIYAERDWELINAANEKVLALFKWK